MGRRFGRSRCRNPEDRIVAAERAGKRFGARALAVQQAIPYFLDTAPERRDPAHARDLNAHAATDRRMMDAFVPPNPNEFERTVRTLPAREEFATMFRSRPVSPWRKLMFGGSNWCRSARMLMTASIAPAAPNECPIIPFVELTGRPSNTSAIALPCAASLKAV